MQRRSFIIITTLVWSIALGVVGIVVAKDSVTSALDDTSNLLERYEKRYQDAYKVWTDNGSRADQRDDILVPMAAYREILERLSGAQVSGGFPDHDHTAASLDREVEEAQASLAAIRLNTIKKYINELDSIIQDQDVERLALISKQMSTLSNARYYIDSARDTLQQVQRYMGIDGSMTEENSDRLMRAIQAAGRAHDRLKRSDVFESIVSRVKDPRSVSLPAERIPQEIQGLRQHYLRYLDALEKVSTTTRNNTQRSLVSPPMLRSPCGYGVSATDCRARVNSSASTDELRATVSSFEALRDSYLEQINFNLTEDSISLQFAGWAGFVIDNTPEYLTLRREEQGLKAAYRAALEQQREQFSQATDFGMFLTIIESNVIQELNTKLGGIRQQQQALGKRADEQFKEDLKAGKVNNERSRKTGW